ncbi:MAG: hypothetical protein M3Y27_21390 [Acidobacteriota bacterium]|nr:hypothetical protein [Acidobacteriota bacterium]
MEPIKRIKRSESMWREIFARQVASGMSLLQFCRSEGINAGVLRRWRFKLNDAGQAGKVKARRKTQVLAPFIDIGAVDAARSRFEVRLELGSGMILSIARS